MTEAIMQTAQSGGAPHSDDVIREEKMRSLQERLTHEMETHIAEGCVSVEQIQERVSQIQQLREELKQEAGHTKETPSTSDQPAAGMGSLEDSWQAEFSRMLLSRRQEKQDHSKLLSQELDKMERELMEEREHGVCEGELNVLQRERQLLLLQGELLNRETHTAESQLNTLHTHHLQDLHTLREESLQVFRVFRQVLEEQRRLSEERYRTLLLEAIQDAVLLSAQNQELQSENRQLQAENRQLQRTLAELKGGQSKQTSPTTILLQSPAQTNSST